jgi:hypothetical protein
MKIHQLRWMAEGGWAPYAPRPMVPAAQLVLVFGSRLLLEDAAILGPVRTAYPGAVCIGCSTAGEIWGTQVTDDTVVVTAVAFESSQVRTAHARLERAEDSFAVGGQLADALTATGLRHVFVLSKGLGVNGSDLVRGLQSRLPEGVSITGGLSGDGARFERTLVLTEDGLDTNAIAIVGFYGDRLRIGYGSLGGWDLFGPERLVTRSANNVLYELDGRSALALYKEYLGEHANGLPATGLLFPLSVRTRTGEPGVVRTILSVDEAAQSMTFAGDVPEGAYAQLMRANFDRLIDGATGAARTSYGAVGGEPPDLAILISCVGRKLVLKQRIEEEIEGVRDVLGPVAVLTGFYSYGEISPLQPGARCELHNQTMTITTLTER